MLKSYIYILLSITFFGLALTTKAQSGLDIGDAQTSLNQLQETYITALNDGDVIRSADYAVKLSDKYYEMDNLPNAVLFMEKAVDFYETALDHDLTAQCCEKLGYLYRKGKDSNLKASTDYFVKSLKNYKAALDKASYAKVLTELATNYIDLRNYKLAISALTRCMNISKAQGYEENYAPCYRLFALAYEKYGKKDKALYYQKQYAATQQVQTEEKVEAIKEEMEGVKKEVSERLTQKQKEISKKEKELQKTEEEKDAIASEKKRTEEEMQILFKEYEEKEEIIYQQDTQLKEEIFIRNLLIGGAVIVSIFLILLFIAFKRIQDTNRVLNQQKEEILEQKEEIEEQKADLEQANANLEEKSNQILAQKDEIEQQKQNIVDSIRYAQRIQGAVLSIATFESPLIKDKFVIYRPKDFVSGDFYWYSHSSSHALVVMADCTGHGVPGAFMSMIGSVLLDEIVNGKGITHPGTILEMLHEGVRSGLRQENKANDDGMDVAICKISPSVGDNISVEFSGAKRPLQYIGTDGQMVTIKGTRKSIGGRQKEEKRTYDTETLEVESGTTIYLSSDGFVDQNDKDYVKYGSKQLQDNLELWANQSMEEQRQALENSLDEHSKDVEQRDDITLIGIKV